MQLTVFGGDFGLPSMDVDCTHAITYSKIANAPLKVRIGKNPYFTKTGKYPLFEHKYFVHSDITSVIDYLRSEEYGADYCLSAKNCSDSHAFIHLIFLKLHPILEYVFWCDQRNCEELTSPWFIKNMQIPFGYFYVRNRKNRARDFVEMTVAKLSMVKGNEGIQNFINNLAIEVFSTLATRLGKKSFFQGESATSLDACVYSYLAPLVKVPLPSKEIPNLLHTWPELIEFVKRIDARYFPGLPKKEISFEGGELFKEREVDEFATTVTTKMAAIFVASSAMLGFAISKNIINIDNIKGFFSFFEK